MEVNNSNIVECENMIDKMCNMICCVEQFEKYSGIIYNRFNCFNYLEYYKLFREEIENEKYY